MILKRLALISLFALLLAACNAIGGGEPLPTEAPTAAPPPPPTEAPPPTAVPPTAAPTDTPAAAPDPLAGTRWDLIGYGPAGGQAPASPATADFADGQIRGTTGCNQYFGGYRLDGETIAIGPVGQTEMACMEEGVMAQEAAFTAALGAATRYALAGDSLTIDYDGGQLIFAPAEDLALEGRVWQSNGIVEGDGIGFQAGDERITAQFVDGQLTGFGGCNQYSAGYELDGQALTMGPIISTKMFCEGASDREAQYLGLLERVAGYEVDRESLRLVNADGEMLLGFVPAVESGEMETDPELVVFVTGLQDAIAARAFETLEALMVDPVGFGAWRSEWQTLTPAEVIEGLRQVHLPGGAVIQFSPPETDLMAMLDGIDPTQMLGPDWDVARVVHSSGWREGGEEMMIFVVRQADGSLAIGAWLYAPDGFQ